MDPQSQRRRRFELWQLAATALAALSIAYPSSSRAEEPAATGQRPMAAQATSGVGEATRKASAPSSLDDILLSGENLYSQNNEELIIRHYFKDRRGGFFVDVGAYHWKRMSTTLYLEKHLGWRGIAIDALERFREGYEKNRAATDFFNYIVTDSSGGEAILYVSGGTSSTNPDWKDYFKNVKERKLKQVKVPRITLDDLLTQNGVTKVDFLSMDIEDGEPAALAGFDIERFAPDLVCVEAGRKRRALLLDYFTKHDYERIDEYLEHDRANWYFRPKPAATANER
jgi:FkbM family methyltransferase